jgi:hypothetical protein
MTDSQIRTMLGLKEQLDIGILWMWCGYSCLLLFIGEQVEGPKF